MKYLIKRNDEYLLPMSEAIYPIWTYKKNEARTFVSETKAREVLTTWNIEHATVEEK